MQAERLDSPFLASDAAHTSSDVLVTLGVIVTVGLVQAGFPVLDSVMALGIAGFIAWTGVQVLRQNLRYLADAAALEPEAVHAVVVQVRGRRRARTRFARAARPATFTSTCTCRWRVTSTSWPLTASRTG